MERLLLLWDEIDDVAGACRHVALVTAGEVASLLLPLAPLAAAAFGAGLLGPSLHLLGVLAAGAPPGPGSA